VEYITSEEKTKLTGELERRINLRKELSERIGKARELGDLKENAEYHAAREDQGMNENRIKQLEERLSVAIVADEQEIPEDMVFLGATVKLRDTTSGDEDSYRLVGQASGRFDMDYIEVTSSSPMGEALMKARIGETVRVDLPRGEKRFEIVSIER